MKKIQKKQVELREEEKLVQKRLREKDEMKIAEDGEVRNLIIEEGDEDILF